MTNRIAYLIGSLSSRSINRRLSRALINLAPPELEFFEVGIGDLPLFSPDHESDLPEPVRVYKAALESADGVMFISPEYNRSIPGALKNAIDWGSRPRGPQLVLPQADRRSSGRRTGAIGTAVMQAQMRSVLSFLNAPQLNSPEVYITYSPEVYGEDGTVHNEATREFLAHFMAEYAGFVSRVLSATRPD